MRGIRITTLQALMPALMVLVGAGLTSAATAAGTRPAPAHPSRAIWRIAGSSVQCSTPPACADGAVASKARLNFPQAVALHRGTVYIADWGDNEVRRLSPNGAITTIAGGGTTCQRPPHCGDTGSATRALLTYPDGVAVDRAGDVFIADTGDNEVREVLPNGKIKRVAGNGTPCASPPKCGDGGAATSALLTGPTGLAIVNGKLYIADTGDQEIRKVSAGKISRIAGSGTACHKPPSCGDGGAATSARLRFPQGVVLDHSDNLFIADAGDQEVRKVSPQGTISAVAGTGKVCAAPPDCGDGGPATSARLSYPTAVALGKSGDLYIADSADNEIREVSTGTISRVAGTGNACAHPSACGDNHGARRAQLNYPEGIAVDNSGNLYVSDSSDQELRWLSEVHPAHIHMSSGSVALAAFSVTVKHGVAQARYVIGHPAGVTLSVESQHHWTEVARGHAFGGFDELSWNRRLGGRQIHRGRYHLKVTAKIGQHSASSILTAKL